MEKTTQLAKESKTTIDIGLTKEARHGVIRFDISLKTQWIALCAKSSMF
jgi:hypothetical protein